MPLETISLETPESLRQMIELQIERLSTEEQRALELASVSGLSFTANMTALSTTEDQEKFESLCEDLSRRQHMVRRAIASVPRRHHFPVLRVCARIVPGGLLSTSGAWKTDRTADARRSIRRTTRSLGMKTRCLNWPCHKPEGSGALLKSSLLRCHRGVAGTANRSSARHSCRT